MADAGLAAILKAYGLPRTARAVKAGRAGAAVERQIDSVLGAFDRHVAIDDPFSGDWGEGAALCVVSAPLARTADLFEDTLEDRIAPALAPGGIAVVQFARDASDAALAPFKLAQGARGVLRDFCLNNFGATTLDSVAPVEARFADGPFECLGWAPRSKALALDGPLVWLVLRKRANATARGRTFARTTRPDRYPIAELQAFVRELRKGGIDFVLPDVFARHTCDHFASRSTSSSAFGLIKLDIHRDIRRAHEVADALADEHVSALFLMMHRHPFNDTFYDAAESWALLRDMHGRGHEIGLHLDPFALIRTHGDLHAGLESVIADFGTRELVLRAATLHGDTNKHIVACGLNARDFFVEEKARSKWNGQRPEGEEWLADHVARYSYADLSARFGIDYLVEAAFRERGQLIAPRMLVYLTDNNRRLQLMNIPDGEATRTVACDTPFRIPAAFTTRIMDELRAYPFLSLFHPQWFW